MDIISGLFVTIVGGLAVGFFLLRFTPDRKSTRPGRRILPSGKERRGENTMEYKIEIYKEEVIGTQRGIFGQTQETVKRGRREWKEEADSAQDAMNKAEQRIRETFPDEDLLYWTVIIT